MNTTGTVTVGTVVGYASGETLMITPSTSDFAAANVGTGKATTITYSLANGSGGGLASNYSMADLVTTGDITPRPLTATSTVASKEYDGSAVTGTITLGLVSGIVGSEDLVITPSGTFADANVEASKTATISYGLADGTNGGLASNYSMANLTTTGDITPKALTATSTVASKEYDGTTATGTVTLGVVTGIAGTETLVITPTASNYTNPNVGTGKSTTISYSLADGTNGGLASNYTMANLPTTGAITTKALTATSTVASKVYNGSATTGTLTLGTVTGLVGSETLAITPSASNYTNANVGAGKSTTISYNLANGTGLASNYSMANLPTTGTITAKALTAASTIASKVYDGSSTTGTVTLGAVTGYVNSETLAITPSGTFADANVGTNKNVTIVYSLANGTNGGLASNYTMANLPTTGTITAKALTAASTVASKEYDGSAATGTVTLGAVTGIVGSETLVITPSTSNYANANVGTGKSTTISYNLANGANGGLAANYTMANLPTTGAITAKALTVTADAKSKTYDGSVFINGFTSTISGFVNSETQSVISGAVTYAGTAVNAVNAGTYTISPVVSGLSATNYSFTVVSGTLTINKAPISVAAKTVTKVYGDSDPVFTYAVTPDLISGDQLSGVLSRAPGENIGSYIINLGTLSNSNYAISFTSADLTIAPLSIRVTADSKSKEYGQVDPELTYTVTPALVSGDQLTGALKRDAGEALGTYAISSGTLANANYTINFVGAFFTVSPKTNCTGSDLPSLPVISDVAYCQNAVVSALTATSTPGNTIHWYTSETGGSFSTTAPIPSAATVGTQTYYASQSNLTTGCESSRVPILVTINAQPAKPTITAAGLGTENVTLTSSSNSGNQWYRNDVEITGATSPVYTIADKGLYTVKVIQAGCQSEVSDVFTIIFTEILNKDQRVSISVFPNPALAELTISLTGVKGGEVSEVMIFDLTGRMVGQEKMTGEEGVIQVEQYPAGSYILRVSNKSMNIKTRFIKQ